MLTLYLFIGCILSLLLMWEPKHLLESSGGDAGIAFFLVMTCVLAWPAVVFALIYMSIKK